MKSMTRAALYILSITVIGLVACSKTGGSSATNGVTPASDSVTGFLTSGKWIISSMSQKNEDNTSSFSGYLFTFGSDGKLTAVKNGASVQGTWHYTPAVTYYGSSSNNAISLSMGTDNPFRQLTRTWNLLAASSLSIKLQNPEVLEQEQVQFQKQ